MAQSSTKPRSRSQSDSPPEDAQSDRSEGADEEQDDAQGSKRDDDSGSPVKSSHIIEEHIEVGVPLDVAFKQWTNYRQYGKILKNESAEEKEDKVSFKSKIGPSSRNWDSEITEEVPNRRLAWRSTGGANNKGVVTFHRLDDRLTRLMVEMEYHPSGFMESVGNLFRMQRRRVRKDLRLFKNFVELQGDAEGAEK